jgi:hypothetical protein
MYMYMKIINKYINKKCPGCFISHSNAFLLERSNVGVQMEVQYEIQGDPKKMQPILGLLKSVIFHRIYSDLVCLNYDKCLAQI